MNKKYMDFVPKNEAVKRTASDARKSVTVVAARKDVSKPTVVKPVPKTVAVPKVAKTVSMAKTKGGVAVAKNMAATKIATATKNTTVVKGEAKSAPRPAFVNVEKVTKRPLSKNVYQKEVVVPDETPSAPVTIIDKPEKDSKVGLVVTIIITIILGAAAGTVAFLLLPK